MMIYRVFFILCLILTSCEKEDENKPYSITITGVVTDEVTGQPVEGATVSLGKTNCITQSSIFYNTTLTGPDGKYELKTYSTTYKRGSVSVGTYRSSCIGMFASKPGYVGSNSGNILYYDAQSGVANFKLYHSSELNLHVKNDTANSIDAVDLKLKQFVNYNSLIIWTQVCNNRKLDSTYVIKNLFGNCEYTIEVVKPGGQPFSPQNKYSLTPKPDEINHFDISF